MFDSILWSIFCPLLRSYALWILELCAYKINILPLQQPD